MKKTKTTTITKTVMEWLGEKKLYDKKILKLEKELNKAQLFLGKPTLYANKEEMEKEIGLIKAKLDSYNQMVKNRDKIQEAIMKFNAIQTITISGKKITIASALSQWKNYNMFLEKLFGKNIDEYNDLKLNLEERQKQEVKDLETQLNMSNKAVGNQVLQDKLTQRKAEYEPIMVEAVNLVDEYEKLLNFREEFEQNVNTQINIINVKESLSLSFEE